MNFLRAIGYALLSAFITGLGLIGGLIFSIISTIVGLLVTVCGAFVIVYCMIAGGRDADRQAEEKDKR